MKSPRLIRAAAAFGIVAGSFVFTSPAWADYNNSTPTQVLPEQQQQLPQLPTTGSPSEVLGNTVAKALPQAPTGTLPFTGSDIAEMTLIGVALIGGGVVVHRAGRARRTLA